MFFSFTNRNRSSSKASTITSDSELRSVDDSDAIYSTIKSLSSMYVLNVFYIYNLILHIIHFELR